MKVKNWLAADDPDSRELERKVEEIRRKHNI